VFLIILANVRFGLSEYNVDEGKGYAEITAHLSFALSDNLTIQVYTEDRTATGAETEAEEYEGSGLIPDHSKNTRILKKCINSYIFRCGLSIWKLSYHI